MADLPAADNNIIVSQVKLGGAGKEPRNIRNSNAFIVIQVYPLINFYVHMPVDR